jgi:hypothetical protein
MEWFNEFVNETVLEWVQRHKNEVLKFDEYVELLIEEALTAYELGNEGELFVKDILSGKKYHASLSAASRTPSDVWGIADLGEYYHIMLVQVKTSGGDRPAELSGETVLNLKALATFVLQRLKMSSKVPSGFTDKPLVLSIGYAGIILSGKQKEVKSTKCYNYWRSRNLATNLDNIKAQLKTAHRLEVV